MKIAVMDCLDWSSSNKPADIAGYTHALLDAHLNLEALWTYPRNGKGNRIAAIARKPAQLARLLHSMGIKPNTSKCLYVTGTESASALPEILDKLSCAGIPVKYSDVLAAGKNFSATIWVKNEDLASATKALKARRRHGHAP